MRPLHAEAANHGVLRYLGQGLTPELVGAGPPPADVDRWRLGAHPDVVAWLWDRLPRSSPGAVPYLVAGGPVLVDAGSGLVVAAGLGTQYALRLGDAGLAEALGAGYQTVHVFRTVGRTLDLGQTFGPGWVFGGWDEREGSWLAGPSL